MLTVLLRQQCRSDDTYNKARGKARLGFLQSFSNSSDLQEEVRSVNTRNYYRSKSTDQVPENERETKDAKVNSPWGSTVNMGVGADK